MKLLTSDQLSKVIAMMLLMGVPGASAILLVLTRATSTETIVVLFGALLVLASTTLVLAFLSRPLERFLKMVPKYPWFQAPRVSEKRGNDRLLLLTGKVLVGAGFQLVAYCVYITILAMFFFVLGEPFSSQPGTLLWATFSGAIIMRLSRYIPDWADRIATLVADFMIPFGIILAIALYGRFGGSITSPEILGILAFYGPLIFMLFPFYLLADAAMHLLKDRGRLQLDFTPGS